MKKIFKAGLLIFWTLFIYKIMTAVNPDLRGFFDFYGADKLAHLFFFAVFTFLLDLFLDEFEFFRSPATIGFLLTSGYAFMIEYLQIHIPGRSFSIYDFVFSCLGAIIALVLYRRVYRKLRNSQKTLDT